MNPNLQQHIQDVISGRSGGFGAFSLRSVLRAVEPFYAGAALARNWLFDLGIRKSRPLDQPVVSIGNITTGGTGKTPLVRWLAERLRVDGRHVAILSRGYRAQGGGIGDELTMLDHALNRREGQPIRMAANPDRYRAGASLLRDHPEIDVFLLDDGFQHRRLGRDFDLVLISAIQPFGFGHVLPRGLLREPLRGLRRADAIVITHADRADDRLLDEIEARIRKYNPLAPLYRAVHAPAGLLSSQSPADRLPLDQLSTRRFFAFSGIGAPSSFENPLEQFGPNLVGRRRFMDHHNYTPVELNDLTREARARGAEVLLTTEKDWVKIERFPCELPVLRLDVRVQFQADHGERLLGQIRQAVGSRPAQ